MEKIFDFLQKIERLPGNLLQGLQLIQGEAGYVSEAAIRAAAEYFGRSVSDVEGVVAFYPQFRRVRPGKFRISICEGSACRLKGSALLREWLRRELGISPGETTADGHFSLETVGCLGSCRESPVLRINDRVCGKIDRRKLQKILQEYSGK